MKKLLILLFSLIISFNSYGGWFDKTICVETGVQNIDGILYLLKKTKPFTGKNLCEYENGQNKSKGKVKDGKIDDKWTYWFENGQILKEENYKEGKKNGKWTEWYENGQKKSEGKFKDDKQDGKWTEWYENGQIKSKGGYKDGKMHGKWTRWRENGQKESEVNYNKYGHSRMKYWGEDGHEID